MFLSLKLGCLYVPLARYMGRQLHRLFGAQGFRGKMNLFQVRM